MVSPPVPPTPAPPTPVPPRAAPPEPVPSDPEAPPRAAPPEFPPRPEPPESAPPRSPSRSSDDSLLPPQPRAARTPRNASRRPESHRSSCFITAPLGRASSTIAAAPLSDAFRPRRAQRKYGARDERRDEHERNRGADDADEPTNAPTAAAPR